MNWCVSSCVAWSSSLPSDDWSRPFSPSPSWLILHSTHCLKFHRSNKATFHFVSLRRWEREQNEQKNNIWLALEQWNSFISGVKETHVRWDDAIVIKFQYLLFFIRFQFREFICHSILFSLCVFVFVYFYAINWKQGTNKKVSRRRMLQSRAEEKNVTQMSPPQEFHSNRLSLFDWTNQFSSIYNKTFDAVYFWFHDFRSLFALSRLLFCSLALSLLFWILWQCFFVSKFFHFETNENDFFRALFSSFNWTDLCVRRCALISFGEWCLALHESRLRDGHQTKHQIA